MFVVCPVCGDIVNVEEGYCLSCNWLYSERDYNRLLQDGAESNKAKKYQDIMSSYTVKEDKQDKLPPPVFKRQ